MSPSKAPCSKRVNLFPDKSLSKKKYETVVVGRCVTHVTIGSHAEICLSHTFRFVSISSLVVPMLYYNFLKLHSSRFTLCTKFMPIFNYLLLKLCDFVSLFHYSYLKGATERRREQCTYRRSLLLRPVDTPVLRVVCTLERTNSCYDSNRD